MIKITEKEKLIEYLEKHEIVPATYDPIFKAVITSPECREYTCKLISEITKLDYKYLKNHLVVVNPELIKENYKEKSKTTDVLLTLDGNIINIEMNRCYKKGLFKRNDIFGHTLISKSVKMGDSYEEFPNVYQINFDMFDRFEKPISEFKMMEVDTNEVENEAYKKYHVNLFKILNKYYNKEKLSYKEKLSLILVLDKKKDLVNLSKGDEILMKAEKKIEKMSRYEALQELLTDEFQKEMDEVERRAAYLEWKKEGLEEGKKEGKKEGKAEGLKEGKAEGLKEGSKKEKIDIAKSMLKKKLDIKTISDCTGLSHKEIENLK